MSLVKAPKRILSLVAGDTILKPAKEIGEPDEVLTINCITCQEGYGGQMAWHYTFDNGLFLRESSLINNITLWECMRYNRNKFGTN